MSKREDGYAFEEIVPMVNLPPKPRQVGVTEVRSRGMGMSELQDLVENLGQYIDVIKWANGVQRLFRREFVKKKNEYLRKNMIEVSTGGLFEKVAMQGEKAVFAFFEECKELGFTTVEISSGMIRLPLADKAAAIRAANKAGLKPKPEVSMVKGLMPGQGYEISADMIIRECETCLEAGAWKVIIEEEGLVENVKEYRTDVLYKIASRFDVTHLLFEASDMTSCSWFIGNFGPDVNLFVGAEQLSRLAAARTGISGRSNLWGRVTRFRPE